MVDLSEFSLPIEARSGIYAFQHKVEGKVYVGQSKNVQTRRKQHESRASSNSRRFHNALVFHGAESFTFYVLEYCELSFLDEREAFWIERLCSLHPNGYNLKAGGDAFHAHHPETKEVMRQNQKARVETGDHPFASAEFQAKQAERQRKQAQQGLHPSQNPAVKAKRKSTVDQRIEASGKFFSHSPESIAKFRQEQQILYGQGQGKFQQPDFIAANRVRVQRQLQEGTHFSQRDGWSDRARLAAADQMKRVCLAVRLPDGATYAHTFESLHAAAAELGVDRGRLSGMCSGRSSPKSLICKSGLVVTACFGDQPDWDQEELAQTPTIKFLATRPVLVTIELTDGSTMQRSFLSQRSACDHLDANHRALRWMIKGEKYNSTKCRLGRIISVVEIDPLAEHIQELISRLRDPD